MIFNYLKTAVRNLLRHKFFSLINIIGLAVAMSICMAMITLVADQMNYDRFNSNAHRIYRVTTQDVDDHGRLQTENRTNSTCAMPLAPELAASYTGIEQFVRIRRGFGNNWLALEGQNVNIPLSGFFADENVLKFFQYELQYGDPATALKDPFTVVLTRKAANKLFENENPVGQTLKVGDLGLFTVTGVLKETATKSHIVFEGLASMATAVSLEGSGKLSPVVNDWSDYWTSWTYIMIDPDKTRNDIQHDLDDIFKKRVLTLPSSAYKMAFGLQPLLQITPGPLTNNSIGPVFPWVFIYFLGGLALVILLTSCFNFTNLSVARSLTRAREIGVRKVSGANRWQIFIQFISESVVIAMVALAVAIMLLTILKPMILNLGFADIFQWDFNNSFTVYAIFAAFAIIVGVMAGLFPAVVLSGFQPVSVLKKATNLKLFSWMGMRKALVVIQFTISLLFIVTVIVLYNQLSLFTHQEHGFNTKQNIMVKLNSTSYEALKAELEKYGNITAVSAASHVPAAGTSNGTSIKRKLEDESSVNANYFKVDEDYLENMRIKLLAGQFFSAENMSNKNFVVINEAASEKLNFARPIDAVGEQVVFINDSSTKTILGVIKNYNHRDLTREITPAMLFFDPTAFQVVQVSFAGSYNAAAKSVERAWASVNPGMKIDYSSVEAEINKYYEIVFGDLVKVLGFISFMAILISCLGLLGMATYATETRLKEISIRKVLGSSPAGLVLLLSKSFLKLLVIAVIIGLPLSYFVNNLWLELIAYRTTIGMGVITTSVAGLLAVGFLTIGSQTIRASRVNPVENLKNE